MCDRAYKKINVTWQPDALRSHLPTKGAAALYLVVVDATPSPRSHHVVNLVLQQVPSAPGTEGVFQCHAPKLIGMAHVVFKQCNDKEKRTRSLCLFVCLVDNAKYDPSRNYKFQKIKNRRKEQEKRKRAEIA